MPLTSKYPRSKTRDMEVSEVKGSATRSYETHPTPNSKGAQKSRGDAGMIKFKTGKIPNKF